MTVVRVRDSHSVSLPAHGILAEGGGGGGEVGRMATGIGEVLLPSGSKQ